MSVAFKSSDSTTQIRKLLNSFLNKFTFLQLNSGAQTEALLEQGLSRKRQAAGIVLIQHLTLGILRPSQELKFPVLSGTLQGAALFCFKRLNSPQVRASLLAAGFVQLERNGNSEAGLSKPCVASRALPSCCIISLSLPPLLSVYKGPSRDGPVPYARQARGIRMAGDSGDGDLQHSQPTASVYRLCQLCAEVSGTGQKNHLWTRVREEMPQSEELLKGLFLQCCYSEISSVMFVQSCLLTTLDIGEKCGVPVPLPAVEIHHSLSLLLC